MRVLLYPNIRRGIGSGHLRRCLYLARALGANSFLLLERCLAESGRGVDELLSHLGYSADEVQVIERFDPDCPWDLVLLDRRSTSLREYTRFARLRTVGIDEGGEARPYIPFLIDTLPGPFRHEANLCSFALLDLPERGRSRRFPFRRVLISFGGEDPAGLSGRLLEALLGRGLFEPSQIALVQGPFFRRTRWPAGIQVLVNPPGLKEQLSRFDLLFTSHGLTAFEALAAGVPVIVLNPSRYHRMLSRAAGLPEIGVRRPLVRRLKGLLKDGRRFEHLLVSYPAERFRREENIPGFFAGIRPANSPLCPICAVALNTAVARFPRRTYFRCRACGILYQISFGESGKSYDESYFFQEYRKQYGKTYLEDFENIKRMGRERLEQIKHVTPKGISSQAPLRLLDVGCAYGPFLLAAREQGWAAEGIDVSPSAVEHVREKLGIPCRVENFEQVDQSRLEPGSIDVLTLWYVIEHFRNPAAVLRRANRLLRPGGVLAFSTPSASGISARKSLSAFLEASPADHFTIWSPRSAGGILRRFGFRLRRVRITGHHPERFPLGLPARLMLSASRLLGLGDTFEVYAMKTGEPAA